MIEDRKTKVIGLKVTDEQFNALECYCKDRGISKQFWLEDRVEPALKLLVAVNRVNLGKKGECDE